MHVYKDSKMKRFISILNNNIRFGKALNALSHTAVGIGHRIPKDKMPQIEILFA